MLPYLGTKLQDSTAMLTVACRILSRGMRAPLVTTARVASGGLPSVCVTLAHLDGSCPMLLDNTLLTPQVGLPRAACGV